MLNSAMKFFDQLEVMPIYQTSIMMIWILTGMIVFQETQYYETRDLAFIFSAMVVCCIGIYFLYAKTKNLKQMKSESARTNISM